MARISGVDIPREKRLEIEKPAGLWSAYPMGFAFALGWTPCIGPILATILAVAGSRDTVASGAALLAVYSLGLGVPFIVAAATFADRSDLVLIDEKIGLAFAGNANHGVVEILDPSGNALAVPEFDRYPHLLLAEEPQVKRLLAGFTKRRSLLTSPGCILGCHILHDSCIQRCHNRALWVHSKIHVRPHPGNHDRAPVPVDVGRRRHPDRLR